MIFNKPKVVLGPFQDGLYSVRKRGLLGWKYLDLWNYKSWRYCPHVEESHVFWTRCCAGQGRAEMARIFNQNPPPF